MPTFDIETSLGIHGFIAGVDEAGRGPWAGPVVAGAVVFPNLKIASKLACQINDSKKLNRQKRESLFEALFQSGALIGVGQSSVKEIDSLNILQATFLAMHRAVEQIELQNPVAFTLIDGNRLPKHNWEWPSKPVIKGDSICLSISAGSIIAKVSRDRIMAQLAIQYPYYAWEKNAGYGVPTHIEGLIKYGVSPYHRRSYAPIAKFLSKESI